MMAMPPLQMYANMKFKHYMRKLNAGLLQNTSKMTSKTSRIKYSVLTPAGAWASQHGYGPARFAHDFSANTVPSGLSIVILSWSRAASTRVTICFSTGQQPPMNTGPLKP